jgi:putative endonuclease
MSHWVYIVICSDNTLYTGYSTDVDARVKKHNTGKGAKYTRIRLPVTLVYKKEYLTKSEAMKREYQIKQLSRTQKLALIRS